MAQKRKTTKKSGASHAKGRAATKKTQSVSQSARNQTAAVLLFAGAILLLCIALIPGESLWGWLHNVLLGLFGVCTYILPFLIGYVAVMCALERNYGSVKAKVWQAIVLIVVLGSTIQIFRMDVANIGYLDTILEAWEAGKDNRGGGVMGALLGYGMEYLFTDVGSKIILILGTFVFLMLVTGTPIFALLRALWKPVEATKDTIETVMENGIQQRAKNDSIDVELGGGYADDDADSVIVVERNEKQKASKRAALEKAAAELHAEVPLQVDDLLQKKDEKEPKEEKPAPAEEATKTEEDAAPKKQEEADTYCFPPLSLLNESKSMDEGAATREQAATAELLTQTLREFGVSAKVIDVSCGPTVTRYELQPSAGVKISRITGLADDIALRLATTGVRIEAPIPNKAAIGIEVPNKVSGSVCLRDLIGSKDFQNANSKLTVALGKDIGGQIVLTDLAKMPHLLIAGTTGSGKSVCTNSMIQSILFRARPEEVRLLLIDPKQVEFGIYNGIPHLLVPVVTDPRKAAGALGWSVNEMLRRYKLFAENNVRDLTMYNEVAKNSDTLEVLPQILIVIDELADLMMVAANEVESNICRLAQMARAAGMHLVIATQRPSVDVITGLIKANIPSRLALTVASAVDSRTILDTGGAEKLLGKGDMLFMPVGFAKPMRVQGCFVGNREVESVVDFLKSTEAQQYDEAVIEEINRQAEASAKSSKGAADGDDVSKSDGGDEMLPQAIEVVVEAGMASTSLLQRRLRLGYARAGRIIDEMEQRGIVGPHEGSKPRQVLITRQQWLEMNMNRADDEAPADEE
ncbi:MAG: DNA translocase FtsK [Clostridia bacterium]|nr:DNA translocase FtsK [Clostridia bacterium]